MDNVTQRVNEYAVLTQQMAGLRAEPKSSRHILSCLAVADLKDTKLKTVEYLGSDGGRVTVSMTEAPSLAPATCCAACSATSPMITLRPRRSASRRMILSD